MPSPQQLTISAHQLTDKIFNTGHWPLPGQGTGPFLSNSAKTQTKVEFRKCGYATPLGAPVRPNQQEEFACLMNSDTSRLPLSATLPAAQNLEVRGSRGRLRPNYCDGTTNQRCGERERHVEPRNG
jgi:hypothetical protein